MPKRNKIKYWVRNQFSTKLKTFCSVCWGCGKCQLRFSREVSPPFPNIHKATYCPWVASCNAWGQDPGGWAVCGLVTKEVTWLATLHFGPYWARRAVGEAWSNQSAGHFSSLIQIFAKIWIRGWWLLGQSCWGKTYTPSCVLGWLITLKMKTQEQHEYTDLCSLDIPRWMGFPKWGSV